MSARCATARASCPSLRAAPRPRRALDRVGLAVHQSDNELDAQARHALGPHWDGLAILNVQGFPIQSQWHLVWPKGKRLSLPSSRIMIHQPEGGLQGQASDIWIDSQEILKIRLDVAEIYSLSTYRPRHKILRDLDRDFYLTAMETIYYGLADEIATNEVMHSIIEMTSKVWDYHDSQQQKLLESRESATSGFDTQTQN